MNNALQIDFIVDKDNNTISVKREYLSTPAKVWAGWTKSELLDQWWAPKPWRCETESMDFTPGGVWLYAMIGPGGEKQYSKFTYQSINEQKSFTAVDAFCDENGTDTHEFTSGTWTVVYTNKANGTLVDIAIKYEKTEGLEKILAMGFREGFTKGLEQLEEQLAL